MEMFQQGLLPLRRLTEDLCKRHRTKHVDVLAQGRNILSRAPYVDLVFGPSDIARLPIFIGNRLEGRVPVIETAGDSDYHRKNLPASRPDKIKAWVSIMYGFNNFCTYCVVPYVRGRERSRTLDDIVREVERLVAEGVLEVTLLGQNVNSYGLKDPAEPDFAALLRRIAAIDGLARIRFTTSHPKDISPPLIACFAELPKLCSHIHLPAQAGSDAVLAMMNRGYTRRQYLDVIVALKEARPDIQITGDMIVGFPGETEEDFRQTLSLMEEVRYADLFSFIYSPRPETAASRLSDPVGREVKQERLNRLLSLQREMTLERNKSFVGSRQQVLVEGMSKRGDQLSGRSSGNRVVNFAGAPDLIGQVVDVRIVKAYQNSLLGELAV